MLLPLADNEAAAVKGLAFYVPVERGHQIIAFGPVSPLLTAAPPKGEPLMFRLTYVAKPVHGFQGFKEGN